MARKVTRSRYALFREREDKLAEVARLFDNYLMGDVLDVGCDQRFLADSVQGHYVGVDITGSPDVLADVDEGLPFRDLSFDCVIAFDVLEHCNRIHFVFDELCRVARKHVLIGLPNMYEWRFRLMFLLGKNLSGKYGLPREPPPDRHRWLFGLPEARNFVSSRAERNGFRAMEEVLAYSRFRRLWPKMITSAGIRLGPRWAPLFAYSYWAVVERPDEP